MTREICRLHIAFKANATASPSHLPRTDTKGMNAEMKRIPLPTVLRDLLLRDEERAASVFVWSLGAVTVACFSASLLAIAFMNLRTQLVPLTEWRRSLNRRPPVAITLPNSLRDTGRTDHARDVAERCCRQHQPMDDLREETSTTVWASAGAVVDALCVLVAPAQLNAMQRKDPADALRLFLVPPAPRII